MTVPCQQENRITRIENKVDKLVDVVADVASSVKSLASKMDTIVDTVTEQERTLKGSNESLGIVAKVTTSVSLLDELNTAMRGEKDKPGIIAAIADIRKKITSWENNMNWFARAVIGIMLSGAIGTVILLIRIYPILEGLK